MTLAYTPFAFGRLPLSATQKTGQGNVNSGGPCRVAINHRTHDRLRQLARRRFGRRGQASRLGSLVLDEYLSVIERAYYGRGRGLNASMNTNTAQRKYDAVLFDMDGVLCDSESLSREAGVSTLKKVHGIDVQPEDFSQFTGMGEGAFLGGVARLYGVPDVDEEKLKGVFFEQYINGGFVLDLRSFPGALQLVKRVGGMGMKTAVASAADRVKVNANLEAIGMLGTQGETGAIDSVFDFIASSELISKKKPDPEIFLTAARGLNVPPERCVVIEDAVAGVQAAKAAGMRCVAVATSLPFEELVEAGADLVRDQIALVEIGDLLDENYEEEITLQDVENAANGTPVPTTPPSGATSTETDPSTSESVSVQPGQ